MRDELLPYYERELAFIRQMASAFREKYPAVAGGLTLEDGKSEDPHVERLIEAFALIAGRIHRKLDDEFPEVSEALLDVLYPHFLRPIPSQAIVQFQLDSSQSSVPEATVIPAGVPVHSKPVDSEVCSFRTSYPVSLWPLKVTRAAFSTVNRFVSPGMPANVAATLRIELECLGNLKLSQIPIDSLRFYLKGDTAATQALYETLFVHATGVTLQSQQADSQVRVPLTLHQVGFGRDEGMLPYSDRSFIGYRLLQEYFYFPEKFLFVDFRGFDQASLDAIGKSFEITIALGEANRPDRFAGLEQVVDAGVFQLGCTPMVNLFEVVAEPVRISHTKSEYRVVPDQHRPLHTEIYTVDSVTSTILATGAMETYEPFYSLRHGRDEKEKQKRFWYTHRRASFRKKDNGDEVYISLVDLDFQPAVPPVETLTVRATCTNRDQASQARLRVSDDWGEFELEGAALVRARCVRKPTNAVRPEYRRGLQWRLLSHLSLNHLSIVDKGRDALQEILRLYNFGDAPALRKQIAGLIGLSSEPCVSRIASKTGVTFCRGIAVDLLFDETEYAGASIFLMASILRQFLGLYSSVNSFARVTASNSLGVVKQWPPLAGEQILL